MPSLARAAVQQGEPHRGLFQSSWVRALFSTCLRTRHWDVDRISGYKPKNVAGSRLLGQLQTAPLWLQPNPERLSMLVLSELCQRQAAPEDLCKTAQVILLFSEVRGGHTSLQGPAVGRKDCLQLTVTAGICMQASDTFGGLGKDSEWNPGKRW